MLCFGYEWVIGFDEFQHYFKINNEYNYKFDWLQMEGMSSNELTQ